MLQILSIILKIIPKIILSKQSMKLGNHALL